MKTVRSQEVSPEMVGLRIDKWLLREYDGLSFGVISKLMRTGQLRLDGKRLKPNARFTDAGQTLRIPPLPLGNLKDKQSEVHKTANPKLNLSAKDREWFESLILHEDEDMLALNKPAGLAVQGGSKQKRHVDGLLRDFYADRCEPKLVHRLDRATSGVLLVAKHQISAARLASAFRDDQCQKIYWALVQGNPPEEIEIEAPLIKRGASGSERMHVDEQGKYAETQGTKLAQLGTFALMQLRPITGRTHQLRAHMAHIGTPIYGDQKYGGPQAPFMALHAKEITFPEPATGRPIRFEAKLPKPFQTLLDQQGFTPKAQKWSPT